MPTVVTFGEIMLRLCPPGFTRFAQTTSYDATYGGGEANVAVALAQFGLGARYVTLLPDNEIGQAGVNALRQFGVDTSHIVRKGSRVGIYFLENGAAQRGSKVIYDRADSAIANVQPGDIDWKAAFTGADWFHVTGITPAISAGAAAESITAVKVAKEMGLTVSCDLNYRKNLWKWGKSAPEVMPELVAHCDVAIGNEEDAEKVFGIKAPGTDVEAGKVDAAAYQHVGEKLVERFPNLQMVAITLRGSISASHNEWGGVLCLTPKGDLTPGPSPCNGEGGTAAASSPPGDGRLTPQPPLHKRLEETQGEGGDGDLTPGPSPCNGEGGTAGRLLVGPQFDIVPIVDRVGGGDSFGAGLIYGLLSGKDPQGALDFAVAASCLKHSITGDFNMVSVGEVEGLLKSGGSGRVQR